MTGPGFWTTLAEASHQKDSLRPNLRSGRFRKPRLMRIVTPSAPKTIQPDGPGDGIRRLLREDGTLYSESGTDLTLADAETVYRSMVRTRFLDERLIALQRQGRIGFHVGSLGEEGAIIGAAFGMREQDWIFPCYR